jgi:hypothetical protein
MESYSVTMLSCGSATAVFHQKAKPPIANDWQTVATGWNWSGGLEQARRMAAGPVNPLTKKRLQNLVRDLEEQLREPKRARPSWRPLFKRNILLVVRSC